MMAIWDYVMEEIANVLSIYPEVRGFQILNAGGKYLFANNRRRWIPDSAENRRRALDRLRGWPSFFSGSNPVPGIETAVRDLYDKRRKMAIIVFGDDYEGSDFDGFLRRVDRAVASQTVLQGSFRIHAIGFSNECVSNAPFNFAVLMRELTRRHQGAFLAMPERHPPARVIIERGRRSRGVD